MHGITWANLPDQQCLNRHYLYVCLLLISKNQLGPKSKLYSCRLSAVDRSSRSRLDGRLVWPVVSSATPTTFNSLSIRVSKPQILGLFPNHVRRLITSSWTTASPAPREIASNDVAGSITGLRESLYVAFAINTSSLMH